MPINSLGLPSTLNTRQASQAVAGDAEANAAKAALTSIDHGNKQDALYQAGKVYNDYVKNGGTESAIDFEKGMKEQAGSLGFSQEDVDSLNGLIDDNITSEGKAQDSSSGSFGSANGTSNGFIGNDPFLAASNSVSGSR